MKFDPPVNPNYAATIVQVNATHELEGLDNLVGVNVFGYQALVSKDVQPGAIMVFFGAETQLSQGFAWANNLHRHTDRNADEKASGYLEDNRRVRAIKLRGHRSDGLLLDLSSFAHLWNKSLTINDFQVGDTFDKIGDVEICKKYLVKEPGVFKGPQGKTRRVDLKVFPTHIDTENWWRNEFKIPDDAQVVVTQKLHGTSGRWGRVPVLRDLTWKEKIAKRFGVKVADTEMRSVAGSRMVVKSIDGDAEEGKDHFYATDIWSEWNEKIKDAIPENFIVYGELIGWTSDGKAIQKNYTYNLQGPGSGPLFPGSKYGKINIPQSELYIYRVAVVTAQGRMVDLSWEEVKRFATDAGLKHVPEFVTMPKEDFVPEAYLDINFSESSSTEAHTFLGRPVPLSDPKSVDEGVAIRYDGPNGVYILKAKSPIFLEHETRLLDQEIVDIESEESNG